MAMQPRIGVGDGVMDVGCGTGQTARDGAHTAVVGSVLGIDTSARAIERARELAYAEEFHNVTHVVADAQVHSCEHEDFDIAILEVLPGVVDIGASVVSRMEIEITAPTPLGDQTRWWS
jgi:ubiquinone/menaquinone biosynthesis C-methylase UbiE